jgi:hypothetical protein
VLPFFRVDCKYLVQLLWPALRSMNTEQRHAAIGRTVARLMALRFTTLWDRPPVTRIKASRRHPSRFTISQPTDSILTCGVWLKCVQCPQL